MTMLRNSTLPSRGTKSPAPRRILLGAGVALSCLISGCSSGGGDTLVLDPGGDGPLSENPDGSGNLILDDPHQGGAAQSLRLTRVAWGRLVQIAGLGPLVNDQETLIPMFNDFVIGPSINSDSVNYRLDVNPVTAQQTLVILRRIDDVEAPAFEEFLSLLLAAEAGLSPIATLGPDQAGVFSLVPRNAAVVLQFDDLLDPDTIMPSTVNVLSGVPSILPVNGRLIADPNHGGFADYDGLAGLEFYPTRVIVDPTLTEIEALSLSEQANGTGFPASSDSSLANVTIRIPSRTAPGSGQNAVLANPTDHFVSTTLNGPVDFGSAALPVLRAFRSGMGDDDVENLIANGFLTDFINPELVGQTPVQLVSTPVSLTPGDPEGLEFTLPQVQFSSLFCAQNPAVGDVISLSQIQLFAEVIEQPDPQVQGLVTNLVVRLLVFPSEWNDPGRAGTLEWELSGPFQLGDFLTAYDPIADAGRAGCFVRIFPEPTAFFDNPLEGVLPDSIISLRFSEAVDPASVNAFDSVTLTRTGVNPNDDPPLGTDEFVVGQVVLSPDLQAFTFRPDLPLAHEAGVADDYYLNLLDDSAAGAGDDAQGPTDLAGNGLTFDFPELQILIDPSASPENNGGRVSRFRAIDEEPPIGDSTTGILPEWSGQILYDLQNELIRPRPVTRFQAVADNTQVVPDAQTDFGIGVQTPLSALGSKLQTLYRFVDFGWSLTDLTFINLDVEGICWSPVDGQVVFDSYDQFEIRLAHCSRAPDEWINPGSLFPDEELSGLRPVYNNNQMDSDTDPLRVVHPRERGYTVNPGDLFSVVTGTLMMPYPFNRDLPPDERITYTWRDTSFMNRTANQNGGAPPIVQRDLLGIPTNSQNFYNSNQIQTIGLPLLMEFNCFPDNGASGLNSFAINLASISSSTPYFRAFSTGGINTSNNAVMINPDLENTASGGFNPTSTPTAGEPTFGRDNSFYIGALDIVVRISRAVSVWFPATNPQTGDPFSAPVYNPAVVEPLPQLQPVGTSVEVAYRGATQIVPFEGPEGSIDPNPALVNANLIDIYGNFYFDVPPDSGGPQGGGMFFPNHNPNQANNEITFSGDEEWQDEVSSLNFSSYYQLRLTFISNVVSGLSPEVSAVALAWQE